WERDLKSTDIQTNKQEREREREREKLNLVEMTAFSRLKSLTEITFFMRDSFWRLIVISHPHTHTHTHSHTHTYTALWQHTHKGQTDVVSTTPYMSMRNPHTHITHHTHTHT